MGTDASCALQGEAIAYNLREMFGLRVPVISVVIGEGGSGGALAIGCANRNLIMENAVYYVASPEACAAILWKSRAASSQVGGWTGSWGSAHCWLNSSGHSWWCRHQNVVCSCKPWLFELH
jgi:acetyl-CoA carboxylase carboxyltransferase component